jgi:cytochrome P450
VSTITKCPFDLMGADLQADPHPYFETLRDADAPIFLDEKSGIYVASRHGVIQRIIRDTENFSSRFYQPDLQPGHLPPEAIAILETGIQPVDTLLTNDPPEHVKYRRLVDYAFTAQSVARLDAEITEVADAQLEQIIDAGHAEIVSEFASPIPLNVIMRVLGMPLDDMGQIKIWSDARTEIRGLLSPPDRIVQCAHLMIEAQAYLKALCEARRTAPREDMISALVQATFDDGRHLNEEELNSILFQLMVAGNESCTNAIAAGVRRLAEQPELAGSLPDSPQAQRIFVEEVIRLDAPAQGHFRRCTRDVDVDGLTVPAGAMVHVRWASANRDERVFERASEVDLTRRNPMAHLGFGGGPHFCVGASLGRAEVRYALLKVAKHLKNLRLTDENAFEYTPTFHLRGLKKLFVSYQGQRDA